MSTPSAPSRQRFKTLLAILIAGGVFFALWALDTFDGSERGVRDIYVEALAGPTQSNLLIVEIDAESIATVGQWPWPRRLYADAIKKLSASGIRSLMIDVDFSARSQPGEDSALAAAFAAFPSNIPIRMPVFVQNRSLNDKALLLRTPMPALRHSIEPVSVNMRPENDGLVRYLGKGFRWQDRFYPSAWNAIADNHSHATWIDYSLSPRSFHYVSFSDLLAGQIPVRMLKGRDVLIGSTAIELGDNLAVPVHQVLPGVVVQALGIETLRQGGLFKTNTVVRATLLLVFWLLAAVVLVRLNWRRGLQALVVVAIATTVAAVCSYHYANLIVDLVAPVSVWALVYIAVNLARLDTVSIERLWLQVTLRDNEALHDRIIATTNDCIVSVNEDGLITRSNPAFQYLCRFSGEDLSNTALTDCFPVARQGLATLPTKPFDTTLLDSRGQAVPVEATVSKVDLSSEPVYTIVLRDLSERVAREEALRYEATHDKLTGLLNRSAFFDEVNEEISNCRSGCLLSLDLDYFHEVNDAYGHKVGDRLLRVVARRIEAELGDHSRAARVGGDGFAIWLPGLKFSRQCQGFCDDLLQSLELPVHLSGSSHKVISKDDHPHNSVELQIFATIGVAEIRAAGPRLVEVTDGERPGKMDQSAPETPTAEALLRKSADAMRLAKMEGKAIRCYSSDDDQEATRRIELVPAIRDNIANNAFHLVYQPKLTLETSDPIGCEVLLRWPFDRGEIVPVGIFIEVAENSRQIGPVTRWVVEALLHQESDWQARGLPRQLAINMSARLFQDRQFITEIKELLKSSIGYYEFEFEITETALMGNAQRAITLVNELLESGGTLSIDDYGTGYSSLAYLQDLNASVLKIDKSFITNIQQHPGNQVIVQSTIKMAHELGMRVVAEGVETAEDEQFLRNVCCDYVQGYYYAKPLPLDDLEQWLTNWRKDTNRSQSHALL